MVDPHDCTKYNRTDSELEEFLIFSVCVAGKRADTTAKAVDKLLTELGWKSWLIGLTPLDFIRGRSYRYVKERLLICGIGCMQLKATALKQLATRRLNLRTCSVEDLESIHGIGPKTARYFLLHTRKKCRVAALDTHILKWLAARGIPNVPKSTPPAGKSYKRLEDIFLGHAREMRKTPAQLDLEIWKNSTRSKRVQVNTAQSTT